MLYREPVGYRNNSRIKSTLRSISYCPFHLHPDDIEIICVLDGSVCIWDSAVSHDLFYGDVYIFNANDPHKIISREEGNIVLSIHLNKRYYEQYYDDIENAYFICDSFIHHDYYLAEVKYLRFILARVHTIYTDENSGDYSLEIEARELLAHLYRYFANYTYRKKSSGKIQIVRMDNNAHIYRNYERMYRIVDYIAEHFKEKLTLTSIAEREYVSPSHLSKYLSETLGITFSQVLALTRCEEAERLLASTNMTVDRIAADVGFSNRKHLATQFRKWFDMSPTEYRTAIQADFEMENEIEELPFDYGLAESIIDMYLEEY